MPPRSRSRGERIVAVGAERDVMPPARAGHAGGRPRGRHAAARLRRRARPHLEDRPPADDAARRAGAWQPGRSRRPGADRTRPRLPAGAWLLRAAATTKRGSPKGAAPTRDDLDAVVARPPGRPDADLRAHHRLQQPGAGAGRHRSRDTPTPPRRRDRPRTRRRADRRAARERRWAWCCSGCRRRRPTSTRR